MKNWQELFKANLPLYAKIINTFLAKKGFGETEISKCISKLDFKIPRGITKKEIKNKGCYPVISQSQDYQVGFSDREDLLVKNDLPFVIYGDHSKTIKFVEHEFVIGADGVKILKPIDAYIRKYFYYMLHSVDSLTKSYGRHFPLIKKQNIFVVNDKSLQEKIVNFLDDFEKDSLVKDIYFDFETEQKIKKTQLSCIENAELMEEINYQKNLNDKLRLAFLREAMQGKLVPQNPDDEPATELLKRIKAEKEKLIAEGKLKKQKPLSEIKPEEIPYEIPKSWVWCRLGEIMISLSTGPFGTMLHQSDYVKEGTPIINPMNLVNESIIPSLKMMVDKKTILRLSNYVVNLGDIIIARRGDVGRCATVTDKENGWLCGTGSFFIKLHSLIDKKYFVKYFGSEISKQFLRDSAIGSTMNNLNHKIVSSLLFPLPPLSEQQRIITKLEQLMQLCSELEKNINQSKEETNLLLQTVLREALEEKEN